jgi:hypothetical protein
MTLKYPIFKSIVAMILGIFSIFALSSGDAVSAEERDLVAEVVSCNDLPGYEVKDCRCATTPPKVQSPCEQACWSTFSSCCGAGRNPDFCALQINDCVMKSCDRDCYNKCKWPGATPHEFTQCWDACSDCSVNCDLNLEPPSCQSSCLKCAQDCKKSSFPSLCHENCLDKKIKKGKPLEESVSE